jgi:hypothetical protein
MKRPQLEDGRNYADNELCAIVDVSTGQVYKLAFAYAAKEMPQKKLDTDKK